MWEQQLGLVVHLYRTITTLSLIEVDKSDKVKLE